MTAHKPTPGPWQRTGDNQTGSESAREESERRDVSSSADFKNQIEIIRCERAVVEAAMAWADVTTNIQADHLERACDRLLAARKRAKKGKR